jgi:hypothetical protein
VTLADPLDREANPRLLEELAKLSGGVNFKPRNRRDVASVLQQISRDIRHTYTLGYVPAKPADGSFRQVRVVVTPPSGQKVTVRTRGGYLAAKAEARDD